MLPYFYIWMVWRWIKAQCKHQRNKIDYTSREYCSVLLRSGKLRIHNAHENNGNMGLWLGMLNSCRTSCSEQFTIKWGKTNMKCFQFVIYLTWADISATCIHWPFQLRTWKYFFFTEIYVNLKNVIDNVCSTNVDGRQVQSCSDCLLNIVEIWRILFYSNGINLFC